MLSSDFVCLYYYYYYYISSRDGQKRKAYFTYRSKTSSSRFHHQCPETQHLLTMAKRLFYLGILSVQKAWPRTPSQNMRPSTYMRCTRFELVSPPILMRSWEGGMLTTALATPECSD